MKLVLKMEKLQVIFLINTNSGGYLEKHYRAQCLACMRILMASFPNKEHPQQMQWNYKFFSETPGKSLPVNTGEFYEVRSELVRRFFSELLVLSKEAPTTGTTTEKGLLRQQNCWASCVYSALVATVHDFTWDAPEIKSPVRPRQKKKSRETANPRRNFIFLLSEGPHDCSEESSQTTPVALVGQVLPKPLLSQLCNKGIHVHWVHSGMGRGVAWLKEFAEAFQAVGGTMVPLSGCLSVLPKKLPLGLVSMAGVTYSSCSGGVRLLDGWAPVMADSSASGS